MTCASTEQGVSLGPARTDLHIRAAAAAATASRMRETDIKCGRLLLPTFYLASLQNVSELTVENEESIDAEQAGERSNSRAANSLCTNRTLRTGTGCLGSHLFHRQVKLGSSGMHCAWGAVGEAVITRGPGRCAVCPYFPERPPPGRLPRHPSAGSPSSP